MISSLAASLEVLGFRVLVGLFRPGWLKEQCESKGLGVHVLPIRGMFGWRWFRECWKLVRRERVSLIHSHEFSAIVYGWIIARLAGLPFVGTIHGKNYFWEKRRRRLAYRMVARFGKLAAVSEDLKRFVIDKIGLADSAVQVIYNGVEPGRLVTQEEMVKSRTELGLFSKGLVVGAIGSLYPVKGHRYLLDAMPAVLSRYPDLVLLLVGRGILEDQLKEQAKELGIERHVRFLGMRNDISKILASLDVFVLPSLSEGLSLALLEAMAAGRPAVATRVGGNAELVVEGETGLLVSSNDPKALTDALCRLLANGTMRETLGRNAVERIRRRFSAGRMGENYQQLYTSLLRIG